MCRDIKRTELLVCDAGSGIRDLGNKLVKMGPETPKVINILMSHLHWDHIQGVPFFVPAYIQGVTINIYGCHHNIEEAFVSQQNSPIFPVKLSDMCATIQGHKLDVNEQYNFGGIDIKIIEQPHPGISFGYRFVKDGKVIVYSTDAEHIEDSQDENYPFIDFFKRCRCLNF